MSEKDLSVPHPLFSQLSKVGYHLVRGTCAGGAVVRDYARLSLLQSPISTKTFFYQTACFAPRSSGAAYEERWAVCQNDTTKVSGHTSVDLLLSIDRSTLKQSALHCALELHYVCPTVHCDRLYQTQKNPSDERLPLSLVCLWRASTMLDRLPALSAETPRDCMNVFGFGSHNIGPLGLRRLCFVADPKSFSTSNAKIEIEATDPVPTKAGEIYHAHKKDVLTKLPDEQALTRLMLPFMLMERHFQSTKLLGDDSRPGPCLGNHLGPLVNQAHKSCAEKLDSLGL